MRDTIKQFMAVASEEDKQKMETLLGLMDKSLNDLMKGQRYNGKRSPGPGKLQSYFLTVQSKCRTCGTIEATSFFMEWSEEKKGLIGTKVEECKENPKIEEKTKGFCTNCRSYLLSLSKEDLVERLVSYLCPRF